EEKFRSLFDASLVGVVIADLNGKILEANDAFLEMVDYTREDLEQGNLTWMALTPRELLARDADAMRELQTRGKITPYEKKYLRRDGTLVSALTGAAWMDRSQGTCAAYVIDITERKRLEAQYLQAQKMEGMGRLAGGIAHDFNNLLAIIMGYAEMVETELAAGSKALTNLQHIQTAATRAAKLTSQLLAFSRRQVTEPKVVHPNVVLTGMVEMLRPLIGSAVLVETRFDPESGYIRIDPNQLEQVIVNIIVNACDAMPNGGKLTLQSQNVFQDHLASRHMFTVRPGAYVLLTFQDMGVGMSEEVQSRLFEPFFTTKEVGKGTGLGLATCYGIIKQAGGYIWIDSAPGAGTTVSIYLPRLEQGGATAARSAEKPNKVHGDETVLLVEDEPLVRSLAGNTLRKYGYTVLEAENGLHALEVAGAYSGTIHLLLTDAIMPQMGGIELADHMYTLRPAIRVLLASGYAQEAFEERHPIPEQMAFLQKPFGSQVLLSKVREVLDRKEL
ncbi:MAG TPA: ATP-binding protein, partial [Chthonomonadaceae bacterium]|nr:ATP-binding protein [Chthonomonadaceae bacterium]